MVELNVSVILLVTFAPNLICFLSAASKTGNKPAATNEKQHVPLFSCNFWKAMSKIKKDELEAILGIRPSWCYVGVNGRDETTSCNNVCPTTGKCQKSLLSTAQGNCYCDLIVKGDDSKKSKPKKLNSAWKSWLLNVNDIPEVTDPCIRQTGTNADELCNRACPDTSSGKCQEYVLGVVIKKTKRRCFCGMRKKNVVDHVYKQLPLATALAVWKEPCDPSNAVKHLRNCECDDACPKEPEKAFAMGLCLDWNGNHNDLNNNFCYCKKKDGTIIPLKKAKQTEEFLVRTYN